LVSLPTHAVLASRQIPNDAIGDPFACSLPGGSQGGSRRRPGRRLDMTHDSPLSFGASERQTRAKDVALHMQTSKCRLPSAATWILVPTLIWV
jgi:hypothetical protein